MAFFMKKYIFYDPANKRLFGSAGVMLDSDNVEHLIQKFLGRLSNFIL